MTLGRYERRRSRQERVRRAVWKWGLGLVILGFAASQLYHMGADVAGRDTASLEQRLTEATERLQVLAGEKQQLESELAAVRQELEGAEARPQGDAANGVVAELAALARRKLDAGVDVKRLAFVMAAVDNDPICDDPPVTKRFRLKTPLFDAANDWVGFADTTITVTGEGESAVDAAGRAESWFDPAKPVTLRFNHIGGKTSELTGKLPLRHALVAGDREHRFNVVAGARGFVAVAGESCRYP